MYSNSRELFIDYLWGVSYFNQYGLSKSLIFNQSIIILAILGVGLCLNLGSLIILTSKYNKRSSKMADILEHLSDGAVNSKLSVIENDGDDLKKTKEACERCSKLYFIPGASQCLNFSSFTGV